MNRPATIIDRRRWLQLVGAGVAGASFSCGDNLPAAEGAAIVEPGPDGFVVALWSRYATELELEIRTNGEVIGGTTVALGGDRVASLDVGDLAPDQLYEIAVSGDLDRVYRVRTAPADDATRTVRIAVGADFDPAGEFASDLCEHLVAAAPDLLVTIGDFPYTDDGPVAVTLPEYRERHGQLRDDPRLRAVFEAMPIRAIYDDHEFRNDWDASRAAAEPDRLAAAMRAWDEFFPLRAPSDVRYRSWRFGAHTECYLLDTRRYRGTNTAPDGPDKTMLGQTQLAWLLAGLAASTAPFKIVFTTVPLGFGVGDDHWSSYAFEREALLDAIADMAITGVLFVSGDQHWFASHLHAHDIREIQIGPMARGFGRPPEPVAGVEFRCVEYNVGILEIDAEGVTVSGLGAHGTRFFETRFTRSDLTPTRS